MGMLYNRLLIILNEESPDSTYYHIALVMLQHIDELEAISINDLTQLCAVPKSTISKFIRFIGYEDYSDFRYAIPFRDNRYDNSFNYVANIMEYMEERSMDALIEAVQDDIRTTYETLDWSAVDRLVRDLDEYDRIGVFGLMFSETAAMDFQIKLGYNKKFVVTNMNDVKQEQFIRQAGNDTLIIVFSDSGEYLDNYRHIDDFINKRLFYQTKAKVVVITSNPRVQRDPRVSYCILYRKNRSICTHRTLYSVLTDIITFKYREFQKAKEQ